MNPVFRAKAFWQPYLTLIPRGLSNSDLAEQLSRLGADYAVRGDLIEYNYFGESRTAVQHVVQFPFAFGDRYSLAIEYKPDKGGCEKALFLLDARLGTSLQMGWWDLAQWHPYCLRPDELDLLLHFWASSDGRRSSTDILLLLLCQFVGITDRESCERLSRLAAAAYRALGLGDWTEDYPLVRIQEGYRWEWDDDLGWLFTSDEYCCYSIRNRPHMKSEEGTFPFVEFREMLGELK